MLLFIFCVVLLCVFTFWVPCCDVRYDFRIKTMIHSSWTPVVCRRIPSLQSDVGPTSVNGRLWRWFDVECQCWPVVILLIVSTLARLIGSTLDRRYNVLFPMVSRPISNIQILCIGRQDVYPDGMFDWSLGRRQISIIQHLSCITTKQTITLFVTFSVHTNVRVY